MTKRGGLFFYGSDGREEILRPKEIYDYPSANSITAMNFAPVPMTGSPEPEEKAPSVVDICSTVKQYPAGYTALLTAAMYSFIRPGGYCREKEIIMK